MRRPRKLAAIAVILIPLLAGGALLQSRASREGPLLLEQVLSLVSERFVDTLPAGAMYEKAARGLVRELNDPYTELLSPRELKQFTSRTGGRYGGLGMSIVLRDEMVVVQQVFPNSPAERNGVREGDRIIQVDTNSTRGWSTATTADSLLGTPGTKVRVKFARPGVTQPLDITFTRAIVHVPAVPFGILFGSVGYVPLSTFNENAAEELEKAIRDVTRRGAKGVIVDLRGNPGGILDQSLTVSNLFLKSGMEIASVRARSGESQSYVARAQPALPTTPLIVLVNERSASASEIVAGALQDHDRAVIIGQTTFGKGLVQSVFNLDGGYALKLTTAKWYTPSGRTIQRERKYVGGRFVEDSTIDSTATEASKKDRPEFRSDAGRTVYGGGGVTPDVIVPSDTLTTPQQEFVREVYLPNSAPIANTLQDYALEISRQVRPDAKIDPAWRAELLQRIRARDIDIDAEQWEQGAEWIDLQLESFVFRYAFGDSTVARRTLKIDAQLQKAIEMMNKGNSQRDLFNLAAANVPARSAVRPPANQSAAARPEPRPE